MRWKTLSSRVIVDDQWLRLSADRCQRPNGTTIEPYYRIHGKDWVNVCPIFPDGTLVLVREYRHGFGDMLLGLPGGLIDAEDATPAIAAQRELQEETGIRQILSLVQTGSMIVNPSTHTNVGHSFLALCDPDGRDDLGTAEPDIRLVSVDFLDTIRQVILGEVLFSGYDAASLLRALFAVLGSGERRFETLRHRVATVFQQQVGFANFHHEMMS
jgi:ADP-ribose pyrophosphatase